MQLAPVNFVGALFGAAGVAILAISHYQKMNYVVGNVPLLSVRAKHVIGLGLILLAMVILLSQFTARTNMQGRQVKSFGSTTVEPAIPRSTGFLRR